MGPCDSSRTPEKSKSSWVFKNIVTRLKKRSNSDFDDFLVIGIDFGTTYSGVAWATIEDFEDNEVNLITTWPGHGREEGKVPTELYYEHGNLMWGYTVPPDADPIRWFKLLLLREDHLPSEFRESECILRARRLLTEIGKTAIDVVGDYLGALWKHVLKTICNERGEHVIDAMAFHVVITVPAIWKDYTRQAMGQAVIRAGILTSRVAGPTTMAYVPEPEAAALATLGEGRRHFDTGDVFVICDAGGGTVDLISYKVGGVDPIALNEAVIGTGGLCGGIFIDEAFQSMCKNRLGRKWNRLSQNGIRDIMKTEWEYAIKPQFKLGNATQEYIVAIPAEALEGSGLNDESMKPYIKSGRIHFASTDIQKTFAKSFSGIEKLVDEQIREIKGKKLAVTGIILVGGLGSSPYLYEHLKGKYGGQDINILQSIGIKPRTAICRGAMYKGLLEATTRTEQSSNRGLSMAPPISVMSTIARTSLGWRYMTPFDKGKHLEIDKSWDENAGMLVAKNQMAWYLRKGEDVSTLKPTQRSWVRRFGSEEEFRKNLLDSIFQYEDDDPPTRFTKGVDHLCDIKWTVDDTYSSLEDWTNSKGKTVKRLVFVLEMIPSGASNEFRAIYKGKTLGSQNVNTEFQ